MSLANLPLDPELNWIFDMDGTLTDPRMPMDPTFAELMYKFQLRYKCFLVTGSDMPKVRQQLPTFVWGNFLKLFCNSGNAVYDGNLNLLHKNDFWLSPQQIWFLNRELNGSKFWLRTGKHIEQRQGAVNFSIVGRNATPEQRGYYKFWDEAHNERRAIIYRLQKLKVMKDLEFAIGGDTSIDIYPRGFSKAQVMKWMEGPAVFFGDRVNDGNDRPLAELCNMAVNVTDWRQTQKLLVDVLTDKEVATS